MCTPGRIGVDLKSFLSEHRPVSCNLCLLVPVQHSEMTGIVHQVPVTDLACMRLGFMRPLHLILR